MSIIANLDSMTVGALDIYVGGTHTLQGVEHNGFALFDGIKRVTGPEWDAVHVAVVTKLTEGVGEEEEITRHWRGVQWTLAKVDGDWSLSDWSLSDDYAESSDEVVDPSDWE